MISSTTYAQALFEAVSEVGPKDHDQVLDNFVRILSQNGDIGRYQEIEQEYQKLSRQAKGVKEVEITTASNVNSKEIIESLNKIIGGKAEVKQKIDQNLIGGVVVRIEDTLIDASVKNNLEKLRRKIVNN